MNVDSRASERTAKRGLRGSLIGRKLLMIAIIAALVSIGPILPSGVNSLFIVAMIYSIYAMGYDVLFGFTNQASLGQSLFFGMGAYGVALSVIHLNAGFWASLLIAAMASFVVALATGYISVRLTEAYFVITTAIFSSVFLLLAQDLTPLTGGTNGLSITVPPLAIGPVSFSVYDATTNYYLVLVLAVVVYLALARISRSPLGKIWIAIKENEVRLGFLGYNVFRYKLAAFVVAGVLTGLSGALYAVRLRYVSADFLSLKWAVIPIVWSLLGGPGTLIGPILGVVILVVFEYYVSAIWTNYLIVVGVIIILVMRWSPKGIIGVIRSGFGQTGANIFKLRSGSENISGAGD